MQFNHRTRNETINPREKMIEKSISSSTQLLIILVVLYNKDKTKIIEPLCCCVVNGVTLETERDGFSNVIYYNCRLTRINRAPLKGGGLSTRACMTEWDNFRFCNPMMRVVPICVYMLLHMYLPTVLTTHYACET